uniref:Uncharacterized protein n=1 Tax=Cacopsylla melanoneura TaxID=428564 RepID=A0A8D8ZCR2_9HEMI
MFSLLPILIPSPSILLTFCRAPFNSYIEYCLGNPISLSYTSICIKGGRLWKMFRHSLLICTLNLLYAVRLVLLIWNSKELHLVSYLHSIEIIIRFVKSTNAR